MFKDKTIILSVDTFMEIISMSEIPNKLKVLDFIKTINKNQNISLSSTTTSAEQLLDIYSTRKKIIQFNGFETNDVDSLIQGLSLLNKGQIIYSLKNEEFLGTVSFFIRQNGIVKCIGTVGF